MLFLITFVIMRLRKYLFFLTMLIQSFLVLAQNTTIGAQMDSQILSNNFEDINIIRIYPNPAVDYIIIEVKESQLQDTRFVLTSMIGNEIEIEPETLGEDKFRVGLVGYPAGFYFLVIQDDLSQFKKAFRFLIK